MGGHHSRAHSYQYTLQGDDLEELHEWAPSWYSALQQACRELADVNSDQQNKGLQTTLAIDRDTARRLGLDRQLIDDTLYDAFGQRQVSTIYTPLNQYHVVMEVAPRVLAEPRGAASTSRSAPRTAKQVPAGRRRAAIAPDRDARWRSTTRGVPRQHPLVQSGARRIAWATR